MSEYPQNRTYAVIPVEKVEQYLTGVLGVARYSIDKKFIVWDFAQGDRILDLLGQDPDVGLYTHKAILNLMATSNWKAPEPQQ